MCPTETLVSAGFWIAYLVPLVTAAYCWHQTYKWKELAEISLDGSVIGRAYDVLFRSRPAEVLVSYSGKDDPLFARLVAQRLRLLGYSVWLDAICLQSGRRMEQQVMEACQCVSNALILWGPAFAKSIKCGKQRAALAARGSALVTHLVDVGENSPESHVSGNFMLSKSEVLAMPNIPHFRTHPQPALDVDNIRTAADSRRRKTSASDHHASIAQMPHFVRLLAMAPEMFPVDAKAASSCGGAPLFGLVICGLNAALIAVTVSLHQNGTVQWDILTRFPQLVYGFVILPLFIQIFFLKRKKPLPLMRRLFRAHELLMRLTTYRGTAFALLILIRLKGTLPIAVHESFAAAQLLSRHRYLAGCRKEMFELLSYGLSVTAVPAISIISLDKRHAESATVDSLRPHLGRCLTLFIFMDDVKQQNFSDTELSRLIFSVAERGHRRARGGLVHWVRSEEEWSLDEIVSKNMHLFDAII
jgi:hypothetical protein